jgi:hypothetical protein
LFLWQKWAEVCSSGGRRGQQCVAHVVYLAGSV